MESDSKFKYFVNDMLPYVPSRFIEKRSMG